MRKTRKRIISILLSFLILFVAVIPAQNDNRVLAATTGTIEAGRTNVNFRESPNGNIVTDSSGNSIRLNGGHELTILDTSNSAWTKVSILYNGATYTGYVASQYVVINQTTEPEPTVPSTPSDDADFEAKLTAQGFPESYKDDLRAIHAEHPNWEFEAVHTGIEWNTLLANELNKQGQVKNLVWTSSASPNYNWRATSVGYDWSNDVWYPYDGTNWFAASDALVTYYLDPRTYLDSVFIFVFESLSYREGIHNEQGVEAILNGSFMYNTVAPGDTQGRTYAQLVMIAAKASGVSPYHLASRMKQEMGTTSNVCATGGSSSYPGIFNLFNIGASDTAGGNAALKGLEYASKSGSYGRPWDSAEKAITGGAQFLGTGYINVGQDTLYTQKFNVTNKGNLFSHQYMTNVQAPSTECQFTYNAYKSNNLLDSTMVFKIPVYLNMPEKPAVKPSSYGSPNNCLKSLSIDGYSLTPTYAINSTNDYSLIVSQNVETININATTVNASARISGSTGTVSLAQGTNYINITVTAPNGNIRTYKLTVVRGTATQNGNVIENTSLGDLNGDSKISTIDVIMMRRIIVGLDEQTEANLAAGDINKDGKISTIDVIMMRRHIVGLEYIN
ncbi:MAG: beta-N-acetylglucosaminidase [Lachnospiraceae bacterium]|nr:beta-N-acetylglucosaminidase [Lachnospiraceae bacterium]